MVREQTYLCIYEMDESLRQTLGAFDPVHSSHTCELRKIVLWEAQHINVDYDCFKILILHETLKTQNQHQVDYIFRTPSICSNKLDV